MTSRIWVDVRGEGILLAAHLRQLGFIVEEFQPCHAHERKQRCEFALPIPEVRIGMSPHEQLPDDIRLSSKTYCSLVSASDQPECAEVARLWRKWRRCSRCFQADGSYIHTSA